MNDPLAASRGVQPLSGIRVLDFSQAAAGPVCTMHLGDFGAEVIKVEPPPAGEGSRRWGASRFGAGDQFSSLFLAFNRNKSSLLLDLKSAEGKAAIEDLLSTADVVVENFKPGVADRLGIGYSRAAELKPDIVYCSISGYGQSGPLRNQPGFDQQMQAYAGHLSITGEAGRPPVRIGPSSIDIMTGAHAAFGILAALRLRDRTGQGQRVETSLYDSAIHMISQYVADYTGSGNIPEKLGPFFAYLTPYGVYEAADREIFVGPSGDRMVADFFEVLGHPELIEDPRFHTNRDRIGHRAEVHAEVMPLIRMWPAAELLEACVARGIPASLIENVAEVAEHAQARAREMVIDTGVDGVRSAGIAVKLSLTPGTLRLAPPTLGNANAQLLEVDR